MHGFDHLVLTRTISRNLYLHIYLVAVRSVFWVYDQVTHDLQFTNVCQLNVVSDYHCPSTSLVT